MTAGPSAQGAAQGSGCVLLVDDDEAVRVALSRQLGRAGHVVTAAASGEEALAQLTQAQPDVVLSDIRMPDMDGTRLLELVHERTPGLPVILMTGTPELESAMRAVRFGAFEYLTKPIDPEVLLATLGRAVAQSRKRPLSLDRGPVDPPREAEGEPSVGEGSWTGRLLANRYRVGPLIGAGGMASVYEAARVDLADMVVAVKVLHPGFGGRTDLVHRFQREAEIVAGLEHANIVRLLDFHAGPPGPTFLVMERLRGATLATVLAREGTFSVPRATFIASQLLAALSAAHAAGVIHRDLKPDNVFLTSVSGLADIVKVVDFGIAKLLHATGEQRLTETGVVLGTPAYMAPEYARGGRIDNRADLYALGCIMYECLSGRPPFAAENYNALLFAIQEQRPLPLGHARSDVSPALVAVIEKAMAREPEARFATAAKMSEALRPWFGVDRNVNPECEPEEPMGSAPTVVATETSDVARKDK